jgi:hypothetical protein
MARIGIITCEILELEFAHLLGEEPELGCVSVLEDSHSARLITLLLEHPAQHLRRFPHISALRPEPTESLEVVVRVLAMGLHRNRKVLIHALTKAAHDLQPHIDVLLLGYGLCGNTLSNPHQTLDVDLPIFLPMDEDHPIDDCVALCLGERECYYDEQRKNAGTFFLTPGWSQHWKRMLDARSGEISQPGLNRLLSGYERALLVRTPAVADDELRRRGREFSRKTGLRLEEREGTMAPLSAAWRAAKRAVMPDASQLQKRLSK